jgi:phosphatidylserine decarboxylase
MRYLHPLFRFYSVIAEYLSKIYIPKKNRKTFFTLIGKYFLGMSTSELLESAKPLDEYKNINEFFTRPIDPRSRPIYHHKIVSPSDGKVLDCGEILDGKLNTRVKGSSYSLIKLLTYKSFLPIFEKGSFCNIYLSPRNYHRFHAPCSGTVKKILHVNGCCYPVNEWGQKLKDLYSINERYIIHIEGKGFNISMIAIGAAAVSKIDINIKEGDYISKGDLVGKFNLGSSIILISDTNIFNLKNTMIGNVKVMGKLLKDIH